MKYPHAWIKLSYPESKKIMEHPEAVASVEEEDAWWIPMPIWREMNGEKV